MNNLEKTLRIKEPSRRDFLKGVGALAGTLALGGCGVEKILCKTNDFNTLEKNGIIDCEEPLIPTEPEPTPNILPTVSITQNFENLTGEVIYNISASDTDGKITGIYVNLGDGNGYQQFQNPNETASYEIAIPKQITQGTNTIDAYVVDNDMAESEVVSDSFYSPEDEVTEVYPILDTALEGLGYINDGSGVPMRYLKNFPSGLSTPSGIVFPDYLIRRSDGSWAVIEYIGHSDDPLAKLAEKDILDTEGNPNLYLNRQTLETVSEKFDNFSVTSL